MSQPGAFKKKENPAIYYYVMNLQNVVLSEASQPKGLTMIHLHELSKVIKCKKQKLEWQLPEARGIRNGELFYGYKVSAMQDEKVLGICSTITCTQSTTL